jgi:cyclophilin family peptidyl-prolyl cis-trans isomerase
MPEVRLPIPLLSFCLTAPSFIALCTGAKPSLTYKSCPFHRIIDEFMVQGGDITQGDGTGGMSIYGPEFEDENLNWRAIDAPGLVCMANRGKNTNNSQ